MAMNSPSGYHLGKKLFIGGEGGWDYLVVDDAARRLYVTHNDRVHVLSADTLDIVGVVLKTEGVHGVAISSELGRGFASNGRASTVSIFDLKTLKVIKEVSVGKNPDAIRFDPYSKRVAFFLSIPSRASYRRGVGRDHSDDPSRGQTRILRSGRPGAHLRKQ